jgi:hypothetical protein
LSREVDQEDAHPEQEGDEHDRGRQGA